MSTSSMIEAAKGTACRPGSWGAAAMPARRIRRPEGATLFLSACLAANVVRPIAYSLSLRVAIVRQREEQGGFVLKWIGCGSSPA